MLPIISYEYLNLAVIKLTKRVKSVLKFTVIKLLSMFIHHTFKVVCAAGRYLC